MYERTALVKFAARYSIKACMQSSLKWTDRFKRLRAKMNHKCECEWNERHGDTAAVVLFQLALETVAKSRITGGTSCVASLSYQRGNVCVLRGFTRVLTRPRTAAHRPRYHIPIHPSNLSVYEEHSCQNSLRCIVTPATHTRFRFFHVSLSNYVVPLEHPKYQNYRFIWLRCLY